MLSTAAIPFSCRLLYGGKSWSSRDYDDQDDDHSAVFYAYLYGFTSVRKKTEIFEKSSNTIDILPVFFEPKWGPTSIMMQGRSGLMKIELVNKLTV